MGILFFILGSKKRDLDDSDKRESEKKVKTSPAPCPVELQPGPSSIPTLSESPKPDVEDCCECENDLGRWIGRTSQMTAPKKKELLTNCWVPPTTYDFAKDVGLSSRKFNHGWLQTYSPWLAYSKGSKGALCKFCVLFPPLPGTVKGVLGSFIVTPFIRYKHLHENCKSHASTHWHKAAVSAAKTFMDEIPVDVQVISGHKILIEENKKILASIISTIIFCGTHDLPLRGNEQHEGVFQDLIHFRIDAGDQELKRHCDILNMRKNATYMSPQIQNEIIDLCGAVIKDDIIEQAKKAFAFSVLADETADISGKEQLSIGLRFFDEKEMQVREEFVGFVELPALNATTIATAIDKFLEKEGLDPKKCVGQGYDGCSAMAGKYGGVQSIIRNKYEKAIFFHCASHKLNLVVNDLNSVPQIRNTIATIKDIIRFFRESVLRRRYAPNIPMLCESRWSQKYKSISVFNEHFIKIVEGLKRLSLEEGNSNTRNQAFQLHSAATKPEFIVAVALIAKYSALLEPVVNALQFKTLDLVQCSKHIKRILGVITTHRSDAEKVTTELVNGVDEITKDVRVELTVPRSIQKQKHRSNPPASSPLEYWNRSLVIPYLDSLVSSLEARFSDEHSPAFSILSLHPLIMLEITMKDFKIKVKEFSDFYNLKDVASEVELWYTMWEKKKLNKEQLKKLTIADLVKEAEIFYPATKKALLISITLPCTTCTVERSFSTLRRVKTWLRSTMTGERLNGLCLMSVHRKTALEKKEQLEKEVLKRFSENPRKLILV